MSSAEQMQIPLPARLRGIVGQPLVIALVLIVALLALGETLSPGFASGSGD